MLANKHSNSTTPNGQYIQTNDPIAVAALLEAELSRPEPGRTIVELAPDRSAEIHQRPQPTCPPDGGFTPKAALTLAARACEHLLTGEPHEATFDPADLELAIPLLEQMAATIRPERGGS